jgi:uncharacterized protein YndB with AHSA1/START domain
MDAVFKALADPSRRLLLDLLYQRDGQTLTELQAHLPMTRFGCMKHLRTLEEAGLVTSRKVGRERLHYLNVVPLRLIQERWVSKYAEPWASALVGLKAALEDKRMDREMDRTDQGVEQKPSKVYEILIRTTPERLWQALTDGEITRLYRFNSRVESTWEPGAAYRFRDPQRGVLIEGEVLEADRPRRLVTTFRPLFDPARAAQPPSLVTWEIEPIGPACKLTLIHAGFDPDTFDGLNAGWVRILSGLKTLLETGEPLVVGDEN